MKIVEVNSILNNQQNSAQNNQKNVNFGSGMFALNMAGNLMEFIDKQGYMVSFLIQDGLGMTMPRVGTGFFRDREQTGEFNIKEATEVFLRESLSGPYMMLVAPTMIAITGLFCKSMRTNTRLIKIVGDNMKSMLKDPAFDNAIKKDPKKFEKEFYKYNIEKFYKNTNPNDKDSQKTIEYILEEFTKLDSKESKVRNDAMSNIIDKINDQMVKNSKDLDNLCRLTFNVNGKNKAFKTKDVIQAIKDFGTDAIKNNKDSASINEAITDNIKNNMAARRLFFNIANIVATLGGLSLIPKIYARGKVAPGAQHLLKAQEARKQQTDDNNSKEVSFKGKGLNSNNILTKLGDFLTKKVPNWIQQEFEYDGKNFTKSLMACLALFGLLFPRGKKAYDRALVDDNGNKDLSELNEILLRDTISSLGVVYTVPILTKCFVKGCEENTGFVLTNRASKDKNGFQKFLDVINPYSSLRVYENAELNALYNNIDSKSKMVNLCEFITDKEGSLSKILSESKNADLLFKDSEFMKISSQNLSKDEMNKKITSFFKNMDEAKANELIKKLMKDNGVKRSSIMNLARGLYSIPGALTTVIISPIILGCLVPLLTYSNTRKAHAKMTEQMNSQSLNKTA